jgi:hypothetical protein
MSDIKRRLNRLEEQARPEPEDEAERQKRLRMVLEAAEQDNERFYRYLAIERRTAFLESVGYEGHSAEDLRDEKFLYADDVPPFTIAEDREVYSTRDGKPITRYRQTLGEVWYWQEVDKRELHLIHDEETEAFYTPDGNLAISRDGVDLRYVFHATGRLESELADLDSVEEGGGGVLT